jgi:hypothetical protein
MAKGLASRLQSLDLAHRLLSLPNAENQLWAQWVNAIAEERKGAHSRKGFGDICL